MRVVKFGYFLQMVAVVAIIMAAGIYELPKYSGRLVLLALMAVIDMRYWFSVRKSVSYTHLDVYKRQKQGISTTNPKHVKSAYSIN